MKRQKIKMTVTVIRSNNLPSFGAFLDYGADTRCPVVLLNVEATAGGIVYDWDGKRVPMTRPERKRMLVTTLMHEFGHALERHFALKANEQEIDRAIRSWERLKR
jgi:hypothetical protein